MFQLDEVPDKVINIYGKIKEDDNFFIIITNWAKFNNEKIIVSFHTINDDTIHTGLYSTKDFEEYQKTWIYSWK